MTKESRREMPLADAHTLDIQPATKSRNALDQTEIVDVQARTLTRESGRVGDRQGSQVALLTPYTGGNFGDAAIQDAMIANLRLRLPEVRIAGITLASDSFIERHGAGAFPICASNLPFYAMGSPWQAVQPMPQGGEVSVRRPSRWQKRLKGILLKIPGTRRVGKKIQTYLATVRREIRHFAGGYRFLQTQQLLIVSGGGQLDEEWGGAWGHPYCLFKWAVIAKLARIPYAVVSVGAGKTASATSRFFLAAALRLARYRSYREQSSRSIAKKLLPRTQADSVVPDLAFSIPSEVLGSSAGLRSLSHGRPIIALSPIAFAKPKQWPTEDRAFYERYKQRLAEVMSRLLARGYFLVLVWSSAGDDDKVASELLGCLDDASLARAREQVYVPEITSWKTLAALLSDADFLIASRLHSAILGFMTNTPTIAISFDPKVDWLMQDVGQTEYLLHIDKFVAQDVIEAVDRLVSRRDDVVKQIAAYRERISPLLSAQYDTLVHLACSNRKNSNKRDDALSHELHESIQ